jgi:ABC-type bacteriocin/lantibiotic exporter with double-glycine peptidase domain
VRRAKAELAAARTDFTKDCDRLKYIKNWLDFLKPIVTTSILWIIVLVIIATVLWLIGLWFFSVILWILILLYLVSWLLYLALGRAAVSLVQTLDTDSKAFEDAVAKVIAGCPVSCRGDLSPPACDVTYP